MATRVGISPGAEFQRVLIALKAQDKKLPGKFKRRLREVSKVTIKKIQAAALDLPAEGRQHTGLRRRVARGVRLKINRGGSSVRIITTMRDPSEAVIPRGLDTPHGWYHPVFGTEEIVQQPGDSWFRETGAESRDEFSDAFQGVLIEARNEIADAG